VSFQIATLLVLSSYPAGKASLADLKRDLAILTTSGPDWTQRMKRLAARVPALDAFSQGFIERDAEGWLITASGLTFLEALERPAETTAIEPVLAAAAPTAASPVPVPIKIIGRRNRKASHSRRQRSVARLSA
jgi:hypothetical protein